MPFNLLGRTRCIPCVGMHQPEPRAGILSRKFRARLKPASAFMNHRCWRAVASSGGSRHPPGLHRRRKIRNRVTQHAQRAVARTHKLRARPTIKHLVASAACVLATLSQPNATSARKFLAPPPVQRSNRELPQRRKIHRLRTLTVGVAGEQACPTRRSTRATHSLAILGDTRGCIQERVGVRRLPAEPGLP